MAAKKMTSAERYLSFLKRYLHSNIKNLPKRVRRKSGKQIGEWILPPFRFTNEPLVPESNFCPCDLCAFARYNALCARQSKCAAYTYWFMQKLGQLESETPKAALAAIVHHLGLKTKKSKKNVKKVGKSRAKRQIKRTYKKPATKRKKVK